MPSNSKARRDKPANNVPQYIIKDAAAPQNNADVVREGAELDTYLQELQQDERLNYDI
mgnify:CR=1 FL=1